MMTNGTHGEKLSVHVEIDTALEKFDGRADVRERSLEKSMIFMLTIHWIRETNHGILTIREWIVCLCGASGPESVVHAVHVEVTVGGHLRED